MYLAHYNLKENPFQISPDPKFIWLGENHEEALAILEYGVLFNKGFLLITGDVGTGKTTLINALLKHLGKDIIVAHITDPILEKLDFLNFIANEFNINMKFNSKGAFLTYFSRYLNDCYLKNKKVILIIDEAQRAPELFSYIQGIVDQTNKEGEFILTGSQNFLFLEKMVKVKYNG